MEFTVYKLSDLSIYLSIYTQNNKTRFFYILYSDKTWVFDQSERVQGPIYILKQNSLFGQNQNNFSLIFAWSLHLWLKLFW